MNAPQDQVATATAAGNLRVDAAGAEVRAALTAGGIDHVLIKGRGFARLLYEHDWERPYTDTDLLVAHKDCEQACDVIEQQGYRRVEVDLTPLYAVTFQRSDGALVDLHWSLWGTNVPPAAVWEIMCRHRTTLSVGGRPASVLDEAASAFLVALHSAHHGTERPSALVDVRRAALTLDASVWSAALALAVETGAADRFSGGLRLTEEGNAVADRLGLGRPTWTELWLKTNTVHPGAAALDRLATTPAGTQRMRYALALLIPPPRMMRTFVPLARRGRLGLAAAYALRPGRLVARAPAVVRDWSRARRAVREQSRQP